MEIKAELKQPYTENERINFIVEQNHKNGYEIKETETALEALGKTDDDYVKEREEQFNKDFFNTSLGYVRRKVSMATGETKDFLSDLLPIISMGVQIGKPVTIITYNKPDFTQEITDWTVFQNEKIVTAEFVQECFMQLSNDFNPVNNDVTEDNSTEQASDASSNGSVGLDEGLDENTTDTTQYDIQDELDTATDKSDETDTDNLEEMENL